MAEKDELFCQNFDKTIKRGAGRALYSLRWRFVCLAAFRPVSQLALKKRGKCLDFPRSGYKKASEEKELGMKGFTSGKEAFRPL